MSDDLMNFDLPVERSSIIKVLGIGGGGSNAVNHMFSQGIKGVNFIVCNTDAQALNSSPVPVKIQIGESLTEGRGSGNNPEIGRQAATENLDDVMEILKSNTKMVFITAGMGGGTGTGGAPVIAKATKEAGILTVAIVTIPFCFEGQQRINQAIEGLKELKEYVDSLLVINNEKLREIHGDLTLSEAFAKADDVLSIAAKGIAEIITLHGYINVDFADVETVMKDSGVAVMGSGVAEGENRAVKAIEQALTSPLLNSNDITGAKSILLNITSGTTDEISMDEVGEITDYVNASAANNALIIWGTGTEESLGNKINVTIIATGFEANSIPELYIIKKRMDRVPLRENIKPRQTQQDLEVHDKDLGTYRINETSPDQKRIDFDISKIENNVQSEKKSKPHEFENPPDPGKTTKRIQKLKQSHEYYKDKGYPKKEIQENIDELEDEPAYVRKNIRIKQPEHSSKSKVSKYSLSDDEENKVQLKSDNSYLNDNVD
jgi:cell division protein FtsZ